LAEPPELPPGATLSPLEQKIWDWLLKKRYVQGLHESTDGVAFLRCVRLFARAQEVDAKIAASDVVARNPRTQKLELTAHARLSRDLWTQIGVAMEEIGGTPIGRARMAGAMKDKAQGDLWADFD
jgi:hypothetical protein